MLTKTEPTWAIDINNVLPKLKAIVDLFGEDYKAKCIYWDHNKGCPECIVGQVLHHEGIVVAALPQGARLESFSTPSWHDVPEVAKVLESVHPDARRVLTRAQDAQDARQPWGEAYQEAVKEVLWLTSLRNSEN